MSNNLPAVYNNLPTINEDDMLHEEAARGGVLKVSLNHKENAGKFVYSDGTVTAKIESVSLLSWQMSRSFFQGPGKPRICWSDDFYNPSLSVENPVNEDCTSCFAAVYARTTPEKDRFAKEKELNLRPDQLKNSLCTGINDIVMLGSDKIPFIIQFKGTAAMALNQKLKPQLKKAKAQGVPMCCVEFDIIAQQKKSKSGDDYFTMDLDNFRYSENPAASVEAFNIFSAAAKEFVSKMHKEHSDMDSKASVPPGSEIPMPEEPPFDSSDEIPF